MTQIQREDVSLKAVKLGMDYPWDEDVSLSERPLAALPATMMDYPIGRPQSLHRDAFIGTQIDAHDEWWEDTTDHKYDRRLSWKKWYNPNSNQNPTEQYPGQVDLIDKGTHWQAKTRSHDKWGTDDGTALSIETWSTGYLENSGTFRVSGVFDDIDWVAFSDNGLRQEEFHVYVLQSDAGYASGTTQNTFAWVYNGGASQEVSWTDPNAIHELNWGRRLPSLKIDYTFEMDNSLPYVILLVRQMTRFMTSGFVDSVTTSDWKNFKLEQIA